MNIPFKRLIATSAMIVLGLGAALAQDFPNRVVTLVVPFAAGGPSDAIARLLAQSMSTTLKQQVIVENVAGAGGTTGAARVAKSTPDGYTLLIHHVALAAAPALYKNLSYDALTDLVPVGLVNYGPMVLMSKTAYPASTPQELFAKLKADGEKTTLAHAGVGSNSHLCGLLLKQALGVKLTEVAYRGTGPAMNDLVGGQVDILCDQSTTAVPQILGKTIKAFTVTSKERLDVLPEVPTMIEAGLKDFEFVIWNGLYAPKGTPREAIDKLNAALQVALDDPTVQARFADVGTKVFAKGERSPEAHWARFEKEVDTWREAIGNAGLAK